MDDRRLLCSSVGRNIARKGWFEVGRLSDASVVPRLPNFFNVSREKRETLIKFIMCMTSGGTNFHIWHNCEWAGLRHRISHRKFEVLDLNVIIGYESASRGSSVPSLGVKNCDLHSNSIMSWFHLGMDMIWLPCKSQFWLIAKGLKCLCLVIHSWLLCSDRTTQTLGISSLDFH